MFILPVYCKFSLFSPLKDLFFIWQAKGHIKGGKIQIIYLEYHTNLVL